MKEGHEKVHRIETSLFIASLPSRQETGLPCGTATGVAQRDHTTSEGQTALILHDMLSAFLNQSWARNVCTTYSCMIECFASWDPLCESWVTPGEVEETCDSHDRCVEHWHMGWDPKRGLCRQMLGEFQCRHLASSRFVSQQVFANAWPSPHAMPQSNVLQIW